MWFDTHTHYSEEDGAFDAWVRRAFDSGVTRMLLCSSGMENSTLMQQCAQFADGIWFAAGVHPQDALTEAAHPAGEYARFLQDPKCLAVGEIGLDYYYDGAPPETQCALLKSFLDLALEHDKPVVIHCRDKGDSGPAYDNMYELLSPFASKGGRILLHAFAGSPEWLGRFLELGAFFGVGGMLTFKKADNIRRVVSLMPSDRILLETDSPYLAPVPFRGKPNHPALLPYTAAALALLRNIPEAELAEIVRRNTEKFFRIGGGHV